MDAAQFWHSAANVFGAFAAAVCGILFRIISGDIRDMQNQILENRERIAKIEGRLKI